MPGKRDIETSGSPDSIRKTAGEQEQNRGCSRGNRVVCAYEILAELQLQK
ncbi:MAG: hypothetical protein ACD_47C00510G0001, partial [uncultured bacterium]